MIMEVKYTVSPLVYPTACDGCGKMMHVGTLALEDDDEHDFCSLQCAHVGVTADARED